MINIGMANGIDWAGSKGTFDVPTCDDPGPTHDALDFSTQEGYSWGGQRDDNASRSLKYHHYKAPYSPDIVVICRRP